MPPFSIDQQVTFLYTGHLETTARFYEQILGLPLVLDQGTCRIYRVTDSAFVGFCQRDSVSAHPEKDQVILTLVTSEVDEWYTWLVDQAVSIEKPPARNPDYHIYHCFLRDPEGYLIEIQSFLDPAWPGNAQAGGAC